MKTGHDFSTLKIWRPPILWFLSTAVLVFTTVLLAPTGWMILTACTAVGTFTFGGISIYGACAEMYARSYKNHGRPTSYRAQIRHLKREIRSNRNEMYSMKNYTNSRNDAYLKMITAERKLAELLEEDYEEPARKPSRY